MVVPPIYRTQTAPAYNAADWGVRPQIILRDNLKIEPQYVYVELSWYDGPREGIADLNGVPHRFLSEFDEQEDNWLGTFSLWPAHEKELAIEVEQWHIFVEWNNLYESGLSDTSSHPGVGGISSRWDEIESSLKEKRTNIPLDAIKARGKFVGIDQENRYELTGPDYAVEWAVV